MMCRDVCCWICKGEVVTRTTWLTKTAFIVVALVALPGALVIDAARASTQRQTLLARAPEPGPQRTAWDGVHSQKQAQPITLGAGLQAPTAALANPCAACHLRLVWTRSAITHVDQWVTSRHALYRVGCEKCHGGDARTSDRAAAHRGVTHSADPSSAVHRMALPATCGRCHRSEANAFARSAHQELLSQGDAAVPTCTSCHSSMAADVPSPAALESQCLHCHHDERQDRARIAKRELENVTRLRTTLRKAKLQIAAVTEPDRRTSLTTQWTAADVSIRNVVAAIHAFNQRRVEERLGDSNAQTERLVAGLAKR